MMLGLGLSLCSRTGASYSPSQLAGVAHWYRSDLGVTQSGGFVSQWSDQIGTAHLVQGTGANQPAYNATDAAYNNQPTLQSTAVNMFLASGAAASTQAFTIWLVGEFSTASGTMVGLVVGASARPAIYRAGGNVTIDANTVLGSGVSSAAKHATLGVYNGGSSFVGVDNWLTGGVSGAAGAANGIAIAVFAYTNGTFGTVGKCAEMIIQSGTPTAAEKTAMAAYFTARYAVTIT